MVVEVLFSVSLCCALILRQRSESHASEADFVIGNSKHINLCILLFLGFVYIEFIRWVGFFDLPQ